MPAGGTWWHVEPPDVAETVAATTAAAVWAASVATQVESACGGGTGWHGWWSLVVLCVF